MRDHEERVARLENELDDHRKHVPERGAKALTVQNHKEKDAFLQFEVHFFINWETLLLDKTFCHLNVSKISECDLYKCF